MATLKSTNINPGDPVTADIINNLVLDLNELNKSTAASFSLTLDNLTNPQGNTSVAQKVYSTTKTVTTNPSSKTGATWKFPSGTFKSAPKCWVQVRSSDTSLSYKCFEFNVVITAISTESMTFQIRGSGYTKAKLDFDCFAVEAS
jgi:hypothetical protein